MDNFYVAISSEQFGRSISSILSQSTGKELGECESEARVAVKILKHHLSHSYRKVRHFKGESDLSREDYYSFEPFDCLLSVFDHRYPLLASVKYLGLALHSSNPLVLRPNYYALPAVREIERLWDENCNVKMVQTLIDPYIDPKNDNSPVKNMLEATEGFVSFDGRMKDGFDFHFYMNKVSPVLRENEFLLTSSDAAYVMSDLSALQLQKTASVIARGVFSNCGHNFNSIKRVFVDREIGAQFIELLAT
jgi:acyl-CoA reductase-like NAD-dependent aldehyde dehydrogenase